MKIDPIFFEVFAAWFNVDVIDLDDPRDLQRAASLCASSLSTRIPDLDALIRDLSRFLDEWHPKRVIPFIEATYTNWFFDEQTECSLRYIITEIIEGLKYHRRSQSKSKEEQRSKQ